MKKISLFLLFLLTAMTVSAQDSYEKKIEKLMKLEMADMDLQQIVEKSFSNGLAGQGELSEPAQAKAKELATELMTQVVGVVEKHYRENFTEQQLDEVIAFMEDPQAAVSRKRIMNMYSDGKSIAKLRDLLQPALLAAFNGSKSSVSTEGVSDAFRTKFTEFAKTYDFISSMKSAINQLFKSFVPHDATPEQLEQMEKMFNTLNQFFTDNGNDIAMVLCNECMTVDDLDRVGKFYSTPTGQTYQRAVNGAIGEVVNIVAARVKGYNVHAVE